MRRFAILALGLAVFGAAGCDDDNNGPSQQPVVFTSQLRASNEVPAIAGAEANSQGTITITFDVPRDASGNPTANGTWTIQAVLSGFANDSVIRAGHIHNAPAGSNAGVFLGTNLSASNTVTLVNGAATVNIAGMPVTQAEAAAIMANPAGHYFNFHSNQNPGGVVRGQLVRQ